MNQMGLDFECSVTRSVSKENAHQHALQTLRTYTEKESNKLSNVIL